MDKANGRPHLWFQLEISGENPEMVYKAMKQAQHSQPGVRIDKRGNRIYMYGGKSDVYEVQYGLAMFESNPKSQLVSSVAKGLCRLLKKDNVIEHLQTVYAKNNWLVDVHSNSYTLYGKTEENLRTMDRIIKTEIAVDQLHIESAAKVTFEKKNWTDFVKFILYKFDTVDISTTNLEIRVHALANQLQRVVFEINKHLETHTIYTEDIRDISGQEIKLLRIAFAGDILKAVRDLKRDPSSLGSAGNS